MSRAKFIVGGLVIAGALGYMIYAGVTQSAVYFVTPAELRAAAVPGKAYRLGGMVVPGSLRWEARASTCRSRSLTAPPRCRSAGHAARSLRGGGALWSKAAGRTRATSRRR